MPEVKKKNIVLLFSDQHNARTLGCYGNNEVKTPHLDRLAEQGVRFTNAYVQNPICTPSRMSVFSGQYPHNHGYYGLMGPKPEQLPNLLQHLKKQGYRNGIIGKIHTPSGWLSKDCDVVKDACYHEHEDRHSDYQNYLEDKGLWELSEHPVIPEWKQQNDEARSGIDAGSKGNNAGQGLDARASQLSAKDSPEGWIAQESMQFIEDSRNSDQPFFLFVSTPRPHQTYVPAQPFWDLYDTESLTLPPSADDDLQLRHQNARKKKSFFEESDNWAIYDPIDYESARKRVLHGYYSCVSQVDDCMGQVINKLEQLGLREETIIIYASDHGDFAGEHGLIEKAPGIGFRAITRIPFLWSCPGLIPENEVRDAIIEAIDLYPTMCSLANIPAPNYCDGLDMSQALYSNVDVKGIAVTENLLTKTIHTKKYKYVHYLQEMNEEADFGELYDMVIDPWERNNLYYQVEFADVINDLRKQLLDWMIRTTRNVTAFPTLAGQPAWEKNPDIYGDDGKIGFDTVKQIILQGNTNYL